MSGLGLLTTFGATRPAASGGGACNQHGIASVTGGSGVSVSGQVGYVFTLATSKTMCGFRYYCTAGGLQIPRLLLWRVSDAALLADHTPGVLATNNVWNEYDVTPVLLAASTQYLVTVLKSTPGAHTVTWAPSAYSMHPDVTFVETRRDGSTSVAMPTTVRTTEWFKAADIRFRA